MVNQIEEPELAGSGLQPCLESIDFTQKSIWDSRSSPAARKGVEFCPWEQEMSGFPPQEQQKGWNSTPGSKEMVGAFLL